MDAIAEPAEMVIKRARKTGVPEDIAALAVADFRSGLEVRPDMAFAFVIGLHA